LDLARGPCVRPQAPRQWPKQMTVLEIVAMGAVINTAARWWLVTFCQGAGRAPNRAMSRPFPGPAEAPRAVGTRPGENAGPKEASRGASSCHSQAFNARAKLLALVSGRLLRPFHGRCTRTGRRLQPGLQVLGPEVAARLLQMQMRPPPKSRGHSGFFAGAPKQPKKGR
jgi:hypothetical protein